MESLWVRCGWLLDGHGEDIKERVLLKIKKHHLAELHPDHAPSESACTKTNLLDLSDGTVIPPLVDCHVHLAFSGDKDPPLRKRQQSFAYEEAETLMKEHIEGSMRAGIFALRDGGDRHGNALLFKRKWLRSHLLPVVLKVSGKAWHAPGRYGGFLGRPPAPGESLSEAIERQERGCDHVKVINSGINSLRVFGEETAPQFSRQELQRAFQMARNKGYGIMVHANGKRAVQEAVRAGCDSVEHGFFMGMDNLDLMNQCRTFWVPTAMAMKGLVEQTATEHSEGLVAQKTFESQLEQIAQGSRMGVPIALGTDSGSWGVHHGRGYKEEFKALLRAGLSLPRAVEAATKSGAILLGIAEHMGTIGPHMPASFLYYRCDPKQLADRLNHPDILFYRGTPITSHHEGFEEHIQALLWNRDLRYNELGH